MNGLEIIIVVFIITIIIELLLSTNKKKYKTHGTQIPSKPHNKQAEKTLEENNYYSSTYYMQTTAPYLEVTTDKGKYGEYLIYDCLKYYENTGAKFLFNCYLYKDNGQTTEIDVIMIHSSGIFVFESKNYNGWIYGSEYQDLWTQTLVAGKRINKTQFYNPIKQNKTHISYLKKIIGESFPIYSVVVFSNECTLKSIEVTDPVTKVIYLGRVLNAVQSFSEKTPNSMSQETLISIYDKLYPYSQVNEDVKVQHIQNINNKIRI